MKMIVDVNPFTCTAKITGKINKIEERAEVIFSPHDFGNIWYTFTLGGKVYDILFAYDNGLSVTVEDSEDGTDQPIKLEITLREK